jgi:pimeloyl-ACP methyl ester carboxylesterase
VAASDKPPIMLIHGACSQPLHMEPWRAFFTAAGYRCVVPALPGHVPSDVALLRRTGMADYFAALNNVAKDLEPPPILIGHSVGGLLAQMLAGSFPCTALVLVGSIPTGRIPAPAGALPYSVRVGPRVLLGRPFRPSRGGLRRLALNRLPPAEQEALLPTFVAESGLAYRQMLYGEVRVRARAVRCPVLVVNGAFDRLTPPSTGADIARKY